MPDTRVRKVTIFVSSPKDVAPERGRVQAVAAKVNREYEGLVRFETVLWEEHFYTADKSFQPQIPEAVASDIVVSIFWTRIGTELPAEFPRMENGKPYPSGTAYELLTALEASKAGSVPDVYVFRKTADAILPMADAERRRQAQTQLDALEAFWSEWFRSEKGEFKAAFQNFPSTDAFEQQIELLLRQWLETRGLLGPRIAWPKEKGSPFPGLAPFEAEHAAVFFGRARVIDEARRRLAAAAERGAAFLVIVGASGSDKSSLARAGLIPRLTTLGGWTAPGSTCCSIRGASARRIPVDHPKLERYQGIIGPLLVDAFGVFLMRQAIVSIPSDYLEAAWPCGWTRNHLQADAVLLRRDASARHRNEGGSSQAVDLRDGLRGRRQPQPRRVYL
jgi:hypothetical protein